MLLARFAASTGSPKGEPWCAVGRARAATGYQEQRVIEIWVAAGEVRRQHRQPEGRAMVRGGPSSRGWAVLTQERPGPVAMSPVLILQLGILGRRWPHIEGHR
ncbi:hypothetical protein KAM448_35050 [Aeromonas caviae]|nr:hypothetical protein KAM330_48110 [Aeromonas hydrophila]BCR31412.1 hypothetical protein KAM376_44180 [Aeromonas caviae]GJB00727.1 hypothetical protein KAM359_41340 [Aeromonas caviae]GJB24294.1 hypothetical protein KAM365_20440 [Aeromonas caviae]GJB65485.1 hypothetical protein KAM375_35390 [Aeromonas caviae]